MDTLDVNELFFIHTSIQLPAKSALHAHNTMHYFPGEWWKCCAPGNYVPHDMNILSETSTKNICVRS